VTAAPWSSITLLDSSHDVLGFKTGLDSVDGWFCEKALNEQAAGRVSTHVCLSDQTEIMAFYALKHIIVNLEGSSRRLRDTAESGADGATTGLLLAQMGVRADLQGAGVGKCVVKQVLQVAADLHNQSAFRLLVVDAENPKLLPYYEKYGFTPLANDLRMVMKMSAVHEIVGGLT